MTTAKEQAKERDKPIKMAVSVSGDVHGNYPSSRYIYNLINKNNLNEIRALLNPWTLRNRQAIVCQNVCNKTLLGRACELGFRDIVKYLLDECEADISEHYKRCSIWLSPLRISTNNLDVQLLIVLISRGVVRADIRETINCAQHVWKKRYFPIFSFFRKAINAVASMEGIAQLPNLLCSLDNLDLNEKPFLNAVASGKIDTVKTVLACCINPKACNKFDENALCIAILNRMTNVEHFLLNYRVFSFKDHVRALELCGAIFIVFPCDLKRGLQCWRKAIMIRTEYMFGYSDELGKILKTRVSLQLSCDKNPGIIENPGPEIYIEALIVFIRLLSLSSKVLKNAVLIVSRQPAIQKDFLPAIQELIDNLQ